MSADVRAQNVATRRKRGKVPQPVAPSLEVDVEVDVDLAVFALTPYLKDP